MIKVISKLVLLFVCLLSSVGLFAQEKPEMADLMRSNGKIYVVVAVCLTILLGLFVYVFLIDRKISSIEKNKE